MPEHQEIEYDDILVAMLELIWGEGFLSPGGAEEVALLLEGEDIKNKEISSNPGRPVRCLIALCGALLLLATPQAFAHKLNMFAYVEGNEIFVEGYFTDGKPVPGLADHAVMWNGAEWHFATADNAARFEADPEPWAPLFGGYCAFAASRGYLAPTIPEAWTIHEDRLYLNASLRAQELWRGDIPGNIAAGHKNWPGILG